MIAPSPVEILEAQIRQELAKLSDQIKTPEQAPNTYSRGDSAFLDDDSLLLRSRITALHDLLELFDRSDDLRQVLSVLIGQYILNTEQRLMQQIEQQANDAIQRTREQEKKQRRDNTLISISSLFAGWLLSLVGTPAMLITHFGH